MTISDTIRRDFPPDSWRDTHVLLAVSGGADSVAMLAAMRELKSEIGGAGQLRVGHVHHGLRGKDADGDEQFVRQLCERFQLPLDVGRCDVPALAKFAGDGLEAAARDARYEFLLQIAEKHGARYVCTAHTADDQAETILHRILRGSGVAGLAGIPPARPLCESVTLVRPLLAVQRVDVLNYLHEQGLEFREDATNRDTTLTRNRIRHELLPHLRENYNPAVTGALVRLGALAGEAQAVIDELAGELALQAITRTSSGIVISRAPLIGRPPYLVREVLQIAWREAGFPLQAMGQAQWEALAEMLLAQHAQAISPKDFPGAIRAQRGDEQLVLTWTA